MTSTPAKLVVLVDEPAAGVFRVVKVDGEQLTLLSYRDGTLREATAAQTAPCPQNTNVSTGTRVVPPQSA